MFATHWSDLGFDSALDNAGGMDGIDSDLGLDGIDSNIDAGIDLSHTNASSMETVMTFVEHLTERQLLEVNARLAEKLLTKDFVEEDLK